MISYDKYQNRIKRIAAVKNFIVRFRALFIALFAVLIAASLALMFTKGMITQSIILPDKIIYGDNYGAEIKPPKAFLSDVEYQFKRVKDENDAKSAAKRSFADGEAEVEEEWTDELPTYAGKYLVRMVTNKIFGKSYSNPKEFEIETKPIDFVIKSDSVVYGEMPDNYDFSTVKGDSFDKDAVRFNYENPAADSTVVWADKDSFRIYNGKGEDVTFCYDISVPKTEEEVKILPKNEKITPVSLQTEYIGAEIDYENGVFRFKGGDAYIETKIYDSGKNALSGNPVNAGTYTVEVTGVKVYNGDVEVTNHYNIDTFTATIKVDRRPVTITTQSAEKEYDGTPLRTTYVDSEGVIEGHSLKSKLTVDAINAGSYTNKCETQIFDKEEEVTSNYSITYVFGTLVVTPRKITLTTPGDKKVYDGTSTFSPDSRTYKLGKGEGEELVSGHTPYDVEFTNQNSSAGSYPNAVELKIKDSAGKDVTRNYEIQNDFGTLTISKREIKVTTPSGSWDYDGNPHCSNEIAKIELVSKLGEGAKPLADDENISVEKYTEITYYVTEGVKNEFVCKIYNKYSGADTTKNYVITTDCGTLKINAVGVKIENQSYQRAYNGTPLQGYGSEVKPVVTGLIGNDRLVPVPETLSEIIDVGTTDNVTTYKIVNSAGDEITESYKISYIGNAKLTITKAQLTVNTPTVTRAYDGTPLKGSDERYGAPPTFSGLAAGDGYRAYAATERIDAGSDINETKYNFYAVRGGVEVSTTGNYLINYTNHGYVTVTPRRVGVVTDDATKEYDGSSLTCPTGNADNSTGYGLVGNHRLVLDTGRGYSSIINAGETQNVVYFKVYSGETEVSKNYDLVYNHGTLKVTPRIVLVKTASDKITYDAQPHSDNSKTCLHGSGTTKDNFVPDGKAPFAPDQSLTITTNSFINVKEYNNEYVTYTIVGGDSSNYTLIWDIGKIIIEKRPVTITTGSGHREYNDAAYSKISATAEKAEESEEARGLVSGHYILFDTSTNATSVTYVTEKRKQNRLTYVVYDDNDQLVTANYDINYVWGEIYVDPLPIKITTKTSSAEYDGTAYSDADTNAANVVTDGSLLTYHRLKAISYPSVTNVKEGSIENKVVYHIEKDGVDLTGNYAISYEYGHISRTVRYVQVKPVAGRFTYNGEWQYKTDYTNVHLKEVQVDSQGKVVSGTADTSQKGLLDGHTLVAIDWTKLKDAVENATNTVSYQLADEAQRSNYCLHVLDGTITIEPRRIIITVDGAKKIYDGTPLSNPDGWHVAGEYDVDGKPLGWGLVQGHTLRADSYPSITEIDVNNVSGILNYVKYTVVDQNGTSVNGNYEIADYRYGLNDGRLTITARSITITTEGKSKTYDGTPLEWNKYSCEPCNAENTQGLLEKFGHRAVEIVTGNPPSITYIEFKNGQIVDFVLNERYYTITDGSRDVSHNYDIGYKHGKLIIEARPLTITTKDRSWDYDGTVHYVESSYTQAQYAVFDTLVGSEIAFAVEGKIANIIDYSTNGVVGVVNDTEYRLFTSDKLTETTYCYSIKYVNGRLDIIRRNLVITTLSAKKVYDGTPLSGSDKSYNQPVFDGLIAGEIDRPFNVTEITDFGKEKNKTEYTFYVMRGGREVDTTPNYIISYIEGELEIEKRTIWVLSGTAQKEYDGTELICKDWAVTSGFGLVLDHTLEATKWTSITDVVRDASEAVISVANKVEFRVVDGRGNAAVDDNYTIKYFNEYGEEDYGTLTVTPRIIRVTTDNGEWTYDGDWHFKASEKCEHGSFTEDGTFVPSSDKRTFVLNHHLERLSARAEKNAGRYENVCTYDVYDAKDESVISNYDLRVICGELYIKRRSVTITTDSVNVEYDGKAHSSDKFKCEEFNKADERGLVEGHYGKLAPNQDIKSVTDVSEVAISNVFEVEIFDKNDGNVTKNYNIGYEYGTLTVTRRIIRITTGELECSYDGEEHFKLDEEWVHGSIKDGQFVPDEEESLISALKHRLNRISATVKIDAGTYDNVIEYEVLDGNDKPVTSNYNLLVVYGQIVINKLKLNITTATLEKVYDGTPLMGDDDSGIYGAPAKITGLAATDLPVAYPVAQITDCGSKSNNTQYEIRRKTKFGTYVVATQNYDVESYTAGTLTVTQRIIWVVSGGAQKEYDGTPLIKLDGWTITGKFDVYGKPLDTGLVAGHTLKAVEYNKSFTDVVRADKNDHKSAVLSVDNVVRYIVVDEDNAIFDVSGNYKIEYLNENGEEAYGKLKINPRIITVKTASAHREYDGTPLTNTEDATVTQGSLVRGHSLYVRENVYVASVTNVSEGEVFNRIDEYFVLAEGGDVTGNYIVNVDKVYGILYVTPREVTVVLNTVEDFEYGNEFTGYPEVDGEAFGYADGSKHMVDGEKLIITVKYQFNGKDINTDDKFVVGQYIVVKNTVNIDGGDLKNYNITVESSTFSVLKRHITIILLQPDGGKKEYDGNGLLFNGAINYGYKLAAGSTLAYSDVLTIKVRYLLNCSYIGGTAIDVGDYIIELDAESSLVSGGVGEDGTSADLSYEIECEAVSYVITPRMVKFDVNDLEHEYMGEPKYHFDDDLVALSEETPLVGSDILTDIEGTIYLGEAENAIDVGTYNYRVTGFKIMRGKDDVSGNYYLYKDQPMATITIVKRKITVRVWFSGTASREFTGEELDLIEEYKHNGQQYGPFISTPDSANVGSYGIYEGDLDKIYAEFTSTRDGEDKELITLGEYYITVALYNKPDCEVLKNYSITYVGGNFEITKRQVKVIPKMTAAQLVYNGEKLDAETYLDYDTEHYFTQGVEGFLYESDRDDYDVVYSLYEVGGSGENLLDEVLQAGTYYLKIELTFKYSDTREEQYHFEFAESARFVVGRRRIFANTPDDPTDYVYDKNAANTPQEYTMYYNDDGWKHISDADYIVSDFAGAAPQYRYYKGGISNVSAIDAGHYLIKVTNFTGATSEQTKFLRRNYIFELEADGLVSGGLTIRPAKLVVVPISEYSEKYNGTNEIIRVPDNGYTIKYGRLFGNDKLTFTPSGELNIRKSIATRITIKEIQIKDGSRDVTDNYQIAYTYALLQKICPELVGTLTQADFGTILSFEQISIKVKQPKSPYDEVEYGTNTTITVSNPDITDYVIEDSGTDDRLLAGHRVVIATARLIATEMSDITQWVYRCKVIDGEGDITFGYDITIVCESDSYIRVTRRELKIEVPSRSELKAGDVLGQDQYRIIQGGLYFGATIEITVNEDGECVANITTRFGDDHNDRYIVTFVYLEEINLKEAEYASRIQFLLSRRAEIIRKDDLS